MGFWGKFFGTVGVIAAVGILASESKKAKEVNEEELRRKGTPITYTHLTEEDFQQIVYSVCKPFKKKIKTISINNGEICCVVNSQSGLTTWRFIVDFNDYGQLSGAYWLSSENKDSVLPDKIANSIRSEIQGKSKVIK